MSTTERPRDMAPAGRSASGFHAFAPRPRRSPIQHYELALIAGAMAVITTAMWVRHGGLDQFSSGAATGFIAVGQLTSLYATLAVLAVMLLIARIPWLERTVGLDLLNHWHRTAAITAAGLIAAHVVASTLGYALQDEVGVITQYGRFLSEWPDMVTATIGTIAFFAVGMTSARLARRAMSYDLWWLLHLVGYLAFGLSYFHETSTGFDFFDDPVATRLWITLHVTTAACVIAFRVGRPLLGAWRHRLRIADVRTDTADTVTITLRGRRLDHLAVAAGQFFLLRFLVRGRWWKAHPYSLSAAPDGQSLRFTIKSLGDDSAATQRLPVGTRVIAEGPYGHVSADLATRPQVALIGGGIGITPIRAIFEDLDRAPGDVTVLYRARRTDDAPLLDELRTLADDRGHHLILSLSRDPDAPDPDPFDARRLLSTFDNLRERDVFLCGPPGVIAGALDGLKRAGVPRDRIHYERFVY